MKIVRIAFLLAHLVIISFLLGNFLNIYVPPKVFPYFNFLALAFPVLMFLNLILILFWIILWKKRAFLFLFLSVFLFKPASRIINYSPKKTKTANLKIITLNAKAGKFGRKAIADLIKREDADIVFLQEAGSKRSGFDFENLPYVKKEPIVFFYSRYKIIQEKKWILNETAQAITYDVLIRGKTYRFLNIYLQPFYLEKSMIKPTESSTENEYKFKNLIKKMVPNFKAHQDQIAAARESIDTSPYPIIMAGDFNSVPNSYEYYHLGKNLNDAFEEAGSGSATSFHDFKFPIRIDYIFTSKSIEPISYKVDRSKRLSDHFPVIATFKIN